MNDPSKKMSGANPRQIGVFAKLEQTRIVP
jgi:hypothetical protein